MNFFFYHQERPGQCSIFVEICVNTAWTIWSYATPTYLVLTLVNWAKPAMEVHHHRRVPFFRLTTTCIFSETFKSAKFHFLFAFQSTRTHNLLLWQSFPPATNHAICSGKLAKLKWYGLQCFSSSRYSIMLFWTLLDELKPLYIFLEKKINRGVCYRTWIVIDPPSTIPIQLYLETWSCF